jgi:MYXO-CTERM domain-containing protein
MDVCGETVPSDRYVDGLPAYAQCDATTGSIWSNNGIDTATSSLGDDWLRTQQGGGYQCTEWAWRYMHFRWNVDYRHGDAREWCDGTLPSTLVQSTTPVHGDLIVFDGGVCGADSDTGHIAVIDTVDAAKAKVTIVEENRAGRRSSDQSCGLCFLHAVANDGSAAGAPGAAGAGGMSAAGGASGMSNGGTGGKSAGAGGATDPGGASGRGARAGSGGSAGVGGAGAPASVGGAGGAGQLGGTGGGGASGAASAGRSGNEPSDGGGTAMGGSASTAGMSTQGGGAGVGSGGVPETTGNPVLLDDPGAEGGCQLSPRPSSSAGAWVLAALLGLAARRRGKSLALPA